MASNFDLELQKIDERVTAMFGMVRAAIPQATEAFLQDNRQLATTVIENDQYINAMYGEIETLVQRCFTLQAPVAKDMRYLLSVLRIVPELERSGDLIEHIARRSNRGIVAKFTPRLVGIVEGASLVADRLWQKAESTFVSRDTPLSLNLRDDDNELDELHAAMIAEAIEADLPTSVAMEVALIARFYERVGDHAVNIASRVRYISTGEMPDGPEREGER